MCIGCSVLAVLAVSMCVVMFVVGRIGYLANLYVAMFLVPDAIPLKNLGGLLPLT